MLGIISWPVEVLYRRCFLCLCLGVFHLCFLVAVSEFQVLHLGLKLILSWFLYELKNQDPILIFYMRESSFPKTIFKEALFNVSYWHFCWGSYGFTCISLFLGHTLLCSIALWVCFCASTLMFCYYGFVVYFAVKYCGTTSIALFFRMLCLFEVFCASV